MSEHDPTLKTRLREHAESFGFGLVGFAPATEADSFSHFESWIEHGYHGELTYLEKKRTHRRHPSSILKSVRTVIMLGMEYATAEDRSSPNTIPLNHGVIARYARGPDYHRFIWDRLNAIADWLENETNCDVLGVADTAPLLERDFARRAGLGWVGKNTMLIQPKRGSYFFLAGLLTSLEFEPDPPFATDHCGTCTACLDACPTHAFPAPSTLDATKCISYWTIESPSPIDDDIKPHIGSWLFGCDICQEVCPWNRFAGQSSVGFPADPNWATLDALKLITHTDEQIRFWIKGTSLARTKVDGLKRNACLVLGHSRDERAIPELAKLVSHQNPAVADAAKWALERITLKD